MSTRTPEGLSFDHGCQYFTASSSQFQEQVSQWQNAGIVAEWSVPVVTWREGQMMPVAGKSKYVGRPAMQTVCQHLAGGLDVRSNVEITQVTRSPSGWRLQMGADSEAFDQLIVAVPPAQAARLLGEDWPLVEPPSGEMSPRATSTNTTSTKTTSLGAMSACWTLMLQLQSRPCDEDAIRLADHPLAWIARDSSKPGRPDAECWVIQASAEWSRQHLEDTRDQAQAAMLHELQAVVGPVNVLHARAHRWRFALPLRTDADQQFDVGEAANPCYWPEISLGVCGDWCVGDRVEAAWLSGRQLAATLSSSCQQGAR